ncbi:hypothetical protein Pryu01_01909 [Paraliobacillus ryukyuensis]|uniref:Uncharacterized protein n=1 Tax=Paraliobacillus ryukyuensis TaxID=200904 RepID=A0A366DYK2_9BACI|nr:hypothetical protein [Paraliobacillus ryukyuensis]RBO95176.1 hypothetical protein DES48_10912 [Paraliobacillus ryukyuensis]
MDNKGTDRTSRLLITFTLLGGTWYLFRGVIDLYKYNPNYQLREKAIKKADKAFRSIFDVLKLLMIFTLIAAMLILLFKLFTQIKLINMLILFVIGLVLALIYIFIIENTLKNKVKRIFQDSKIYPKIANKFQTIAVILYLIVLVVIVSFSVTTLSIKGTQAVDVKIKDTNHIPLELSLVNYKKPTVKVKIESKNILIKKLI